MINQTALRKAFSNEPKTIKRISISQVTWNTIGKLVETGNGKYGSSFLNVAARILAFILGADAKSKPDAFHAEADKIVDALNAILKPASSTEINRIRLRLEIIANVLFNISESLRQREKLAANVDQWLDNNKE